jgi:hypothetical protein
MHPGAKAAQKKVVAAPLAIWPPGRPERVDDVAQWRDAVKFPAYKNCRFLFLVAVISDVFAKKRV